MGSLTLVIASALLMVPREYHIDCSGWNGAVVIEFGIYITAMDSTVLKTCIEVQPNTTPEDVRDAIESQFKRAGWRYRLVGKGIIVLEGAKGATIRTVEFKAKDWKPAVRVALIPAMPLPPEKK